MCLRCTFKQPEALICRTIERLATSRHRTMAPLIESLQEPRGCNATPVDKTGEGETSPTSKWKMHSC